MQGTLFVFCNDAVLCHKIDKTHAWNVIQTVKKLKLNGYFWETLCNIDHFGSKDTKYKEGNLSLREDPVLFIYSVTAHKRWHNKGFGIK